RLAGAKRGRFLQLYLRAKEATAKPSLFLARAGSEQARALFLAPVNVGYQQEEIGDGTGRARLATSLGSNRGQNCIYFVTEEDGKLGVFHFKDAKLECLPRVSRVANPPELQCLRPRECAWIHPSLSIAVRSSGKSGPSTSNCRKRRMYHVPDCDLVLRASFTLLVSDEGEMAFTTFLFFSSAGGILAVAVGDTIFSTNASRVLGFLILGNGKLGDYLKMYANI
ncbi:hypothetical protein Taro_051318, partial [Colocasia esculenta]|nr:hypothetical protein [Colocasia esculenta]